jgi:hypothetical protein
MRRGSGSIGQVDQEQPRMDKVERLQRRRRDRYVAALDLHAARCQRLEQPSVEIGGEDLA